MRTSEQYPFSQTQGVQFDHNGHPTCQADNEDTTTPDILYEGYTSLNMVKKTDTTTPDIVIRTWATGTWANRATLTYL